MPSSESLRPLPETTYRALRWGSSTDLPSALERAGVEVLVASDSEQPPKPDAIFPNNWVSFHRDGTVALYPMLAPNRRWERREEVLEQVVRQGGFRVSRTVDLTHRELRRNISRARAAWCWTARTAWHTPVRRRAPIWMCSASSRSSWTMNS